MRQNLLDLIDKTIIYKYDLPNNGTGVLQTIFSTENDKCYAAQNKEDLAEIIYNAIVDYAFNEFEIEGKDYDKLHAVALQTKLKYNPDIDESEKLKYGFFGEVLLYCILAIHFKAKPLIARGKFFNPLENSETKGFDSYHLVENNGNTELWFGEVKFYIQYASALKKIIENIDKALSDEYLQRNILALHNHKNSFNITGSKIDAILTSWENDPEIIIAEEAKKYNMKLIYPIMLLYEQDAGGYDESIKKAIDHIKNSYPAKNFTLSIDYSIFFILMPLEKVKEIKSSVIAWIESKKQLM